MMLRHQPKRRDFGRKHRRESEMNTPRKRSTEVAPKRRQALSPDRLIDPNDPLSPSSIAPTDPIDGEQPMSVEHQQTNYRTGVSGVESIAEDILLDAARSLIKGDLHVGKQRARRYVVRGTNGPIIRDLTGAQVAEFMVATWRYYTKNGSIHMGRRFLFCDIKKRDLSL
jgi:hypothetical protein